MGDLQTRATTLLFELELPNRVYSVALSSDNKLIAIGGKSDMLRYDTYLFL